RGLSRRELAARRYGPRSRRLRAAPARSVAAAKPECLPARVDSALIRDPLERDEQAAVRALEAVVAPCGTGQELLAEALAAVRADDVENCCLGGYLGHRPTVAENANPSFGRCLRPPGAVYCSQEEIACFRGTWTGLRAARRRRTGGPR